MHSSLQIPFGTTLVTLVDPLARAHAQERESRHDAVVGRLRMLSSLFTVEVCAYAESAKGHHLVLFADRSRAQLLTQEQVIERWTSLFVTRVCIARYLAAGATEAEREFAESMVELWRARLHDLGWFIACLNEHLARAGEEQSRTTCKARVLAAKHAYAIVHIDRARSRRRCRWARDARNSVVEASGILTVRGAERYDRRPATRSDPGFPRG